MGASSCKEICFKYKKKRAGWHTGGPARYCKTCQTFFTQEMVDSWPADRRTPITCICCRRRTSGRPHTKRRCVVRAEALELFLNTESEVARRISIETEEGNKIECQTPT